MNCLMCRTVMERQPRKVGGAPMFKCLACGSESSSPVTESVTPAHERVIKAHTEKCNFCGGGTMAFDSVREIDATLRIALFMCQDSTRPCGCADPFCEEKRGISGCGRMYRIPERMWPDLTPYAGATLRYIIMLLDREEDEEAFAHKSNQGNAER